MIASRPPNKYWGEKKPNKQKTLDLRNKLFLEEGDATSTQTSLFWLGVGGVFTLALYSNGEGEAIIFHNFCCKKKKKPGIKV